MHLLSELQSITENERENYVFNEKIKQNKLEHKK